MTGFEPRPRRGREPSPHDQANIRRELGRILERTRVVAASDRAAFTEGTAAYDVASMAVIRLAGIFERPEAAHLAARLTDDERQAIRTTRNIVAHAGYQGMNDDLFWLAITERVPAIVSRLLA